jgi:hypothetical protein
MVVHRAGRPGRVHEFIVQALLDIVDDLLLVGRYGVVEQTESRGVFDGESLETGADCRQQILSDKAHDPFLISISQDASCFPRLTIGFAAGAR